MTDSLYIDNTSIRFLPLEEWAKNFKKSWQRANVLLADTFRFDCMPLMRQEELESFYYDIKYNDSKTNLLSHTICKLGMLNMTLEFDDTKNIMFSTFTIGLIYDIDQDEKTMPFIKVCFDEVSGVNINIIGQNTYREMFDTNQLDIDISRAIEETVLIDNLNEVFDSELNPQYTNEMLLDIIGLITELFCF